MPYKNKEDSRKKWTEWYHAHKDEYDRHYAERRRNNRQRIAQNQRAYYQGLRLKVLTYYGGKCECCGENRIEFLAIDHVNGRGSGAAHRKQIGYGRGGSWFYLWIIRNGYPLGLRILCHNCNTSIGFYGYCPHSENDGAWHAELEAHQAVMWRVIKCGFCGKEKRTKSEAARFCSKQCQQKAKRQLQRIEIGRQIPELRECVYCGKEFRPRAYNSLHCSPRCYMKTWGLKHTEANKVRCAAYYKEHKKRKIPEDIWEAEYLVSQGIEMSKPEVMR